MAAQGKQVTTDAEDGEVCTTVDDAISRARLRLSPGTVFEVRQSADKSKTAWYWSHGRYGDMAALPVFRDDAAALDGLRGCYVVARLAA